MAVVPKEQAREQQERVARTVLRFLRSRAKLDELIARSASQGRVPFDDINRFVEGELFALKEDCHSLFRGDHLPEEEHLDAGGLFDLLMGSLFHQMMKVKENTYQIERYAPRYAALRKAMKGPDAPENGAAFLREGERIVQRSRRALRQDFKHAIELFHEATIVLRHVLCENHDNPLLVRTLLDNGDAVEAVYGHRTLDDVISEMFDGRPAEAFLVAAGDLLHGGWYDRARDYCQQALELEPDNRHAGHLLSKINSAASSHMN
ncbi:hypothetical protein ACFL09_04945 [Planctomycetota bacterium]